MIDPLFGWSWIPLVQRQDAAQSVRRKPVIREALLEPAVFYDTGGPGELVSGPGHAARFTAPT